MSMGIIESGEYNKVAAQGVSGRGYFAGFDREILFENHTITGNGELIHYNKEVVVPEDGLYLFRIGSAYSNLADTGLHENGCYCGFKNANGDVRLTLQMNVWNAAFPQHATSIVHLKKGTRAWFQSRAYVTAANPCTMHFQLTKLKEEVSE